MALAELISVLEAEAERASAAAIDAARTEADRIRDTAEHDAAGRVEARLAIRRAELEAEEERAVAAATREARRRLLESRARLLERVRTAVQARLAEIAERPACRSLLPREAAEAVALLDGRDPVVTAAPATLLEALRQEPALAGLPAEPGDTPGVRLAARDGSLTIDLTLARRLDRRWPALAREIITALETTA